MADEIKLKAPTVEQQVVININGEDKLIKLADTLDKISKGRGLQKYWKDQQTLINDTIKAYNNFNKSASQVDATELIKTTNALKAMSGADISTLIPDFDKFTSTLSKAEGIAGHLTDAFTEKAFRDAFSSFETLKAYGLDSENFFKHFDLDINTASLQESLRLTEQEIRRVRIELSETQEELQSKKIELDSFIDGSGLTEQVEKLRNLEDEVERVREEAYYEFRNFLESNNFNGTDIYEWGRFSDYFEQIREGSLTAKEAIGKFKSEYSYLLQEKFSESGGLFNLQQVKEFEGRLESILVRVEEISRQMNDIIENGVMAKTIQNLSVDDSINQSQRDLFANVLKDEESLSSIASVLKKIIDESISLQGVNTKTFDEEQFNKLLVLFEKIESSLSSMKYVLVDVGDGKEFSPLLEMIHNVQSSIKQLSKSIKGISFNMNINVNSDSEAEAKVQSKISNALQAYQRLFEHIKMSGVGGSAINTSFFEFDINQYDTMMAKLQAYKKFIENMRKEAKLYFNGEDVLYHDTDKSYWTAASSAMGQVTKAYNELNSSGDDNPLENLFGKTDLTEVVSQLGLIVAKLEEIFSTAIEFKNAFKEGFNISTSIEEIEKLTNRLKELEDELSKIKASDISISPVETNISSPIKDTFQEETKSSVESSAPVIKGEAKAMEQVAESAEKASKGKDKFASSNTEVKNSAYKSTESIKNESESFEKLNKSLNKNSGGFQKKLESLSFIPDDNHRYPEFQKQIDNLTSSIAEFETLRAKISNSPNGVVNEEDLKRVEELTGSITGLISAMEKTPKSQRGYTDISVSKAAEKVNSILKENPRFSKQAQNAIKAYYNELVSGNPSEPIDKILNKVYELTRAERKAGRAGKGFLDIFNNKVLYNAAAQLAGYYLSLMDIVRYFEYGITAIRDFDSALTEMRKVSDESITTLRDFQDASFELAEQVGSTSLEIQNSTSDWMKLGFSLKQASKLAQDSNIYANVGDMEIDEATEHMISSIQAWQSEFSSATEASTAIVDRYNEVGNNFAITSADIGSAMERSAAALKAGGNDLNESIGIITAGNLIQQDADTTANALKVLSLRIRGAKADLESMGESTDDLVDSTSKMREQVKALTGVDIMIDENTFKSTAKIIQEIGSEWSKLTDVSQAATLELLAGKTRASTVAGLIENYKTIEEVIKSCEESEGSALEENQKYIDSIDGRINILQSKLQELAKVSIDENVIKGGISFLTTALELVTKIVDNVGVLRTLLIGISGIAAFKNVGRPKMFGLYKYAEYNMCSLGY